MGASLWLLEMGNLLLSAHRRKRITADKRRELAAAAAALRIKVDREPVAITALDDIAASYGLNAYDAAYLELSLGRGLPLATLDDAPGSRDGQSWRARRGAGCSIPMKKLQADWRRV